MGSGAEPTRMPARAPAWHRSCPAALELGHARDGAVSSPSRSKGGPHDPAVERHGARAGAAAPGHRAELRVRSAAGGTRPDLRRARPADPPGHARPSPVRVPGAGPLRRPRVPARLTTAEAWWRSAGVAL